MKTPVKIAMVVAGVLVVGIMMYYYLVPTDRAVTPPLMRDVTHQRGALDAFGASDAGAYPGGSAVSGASRGSVPTSGGMATSGSAAADVGARIGTMSTIPAPAPGGASGRGAAGSAGSSGIGVGLSSSAGSASAGGYGPRPGAPTTQRAGTGAPAVPPTPTASAPPRVPAPAPVPAPQVKPPTFTIRAGDTFVTVAKTVYGDGARWRDIAQANPLVDPKRLKTGQVIRLPTPPPGARADAGTGGVARDNSSPGTPGTPGTAGTPGTPGTPVAAAHEPYTIKPGDTLSGIARQVYGDRELWRVIYQANRKTIGDDPTELNPGDKLVIPPAPAKRSH